MKQVIKGLKNKRCVIGIALALFATVYLFIFSWSTSVLYGDSNISLIDSGVFRMMGKMTKEGMMPYKEIFDHKGPFILLIQIIGMTISDGRSGIFLIQLIFLTITACGIYKILRLYFSTKKSLILTIFSFFILNIYFSGGNLTEEYCLPFLVWSTYLAVKYIKNSKEDEEHNPLYSLVYGISFAVCALTRITNAFPLCCVVLCGFVLLLKRKQWLNIIKNILFFILGIIVMSIPFVAYFWINGALYDMIYATFIYNFRYASAANGRLPIVENIIAMKIELLPIVCSGIIGISGWVYKKENNIVNGYVLLGSAMAIVFQLNSRPYAHYLMIWLPVIIVSVGIIGQIAEEKKIGNIVVLCGAICTVLIFCKNGLLIHDSERIYQDDIGKIYREEVRNIVEQIEPENRDKVIAYNVSPYFYLMSDVKPCYKYFVLQDRQSSLDKEMYNEIENEIKSLEAKYIVISAEETHNVDKLVKEYYYELSRTDRFVLMKLK